MKKHLIVVGILIVSLLLSSCSSSQQIQGAMTGSMLGGIFGSSIGTLMEGHRGYHKGQALGILIGGAVGAAAASPENKSANISRYDERPLRRNYREIQETSEVADINRLKSEYAQLSVENLRFIDSNNNRAIDANEHCQLVFEIFNRGSSTLYQISPVITVSDSKHILVSPTAIIESIAPGSGVKYTAEVYGKKNLSQGVADFSLGFVKGQLIYTDQTFQLATHKARR